MPSSPDPGVRGRVRRRAWGAALLIGATAMPSARAVTTFYQDRIGPIMERHCVACHGEEKQKGKLRLDSFERLLKGGVSGEVVRAGDVKGSELYRRITLPASDEEAMPADGKPLLSAAEIKNIELWIAGGASDTKLVADFPGAPALGRPKAESAPLAPDWRPRAAEIAALAAKFGVRLVARSATATDGLVLRTASSPSRCDDAVIAGLAPVADLIVEAELARTRVTDVGVRQLRGWTNLRSLDLTRTAVSSGGLAALTGLPVLEAINLTDTKVDDVGVAHLQTLPALRQLWLFGTAASSGSGDRAMAPRK